MVQRGGHCHQNIPRDAWVHLYTIFLFKSGATSRVVLEALVCQEWQQRGGLWYLYARGSLQILDLLPHTLLRNLPFRTVSVSLLFAGTTRFFSQLLGQTGQHLSSSGRHGQCASAWTWLPECSFVAAAPVICVFGSAHIRYYSKIHYNKLDTVMDGNGKSYDWRKQCHARMMCGFLISQLSLSSHLLQKMPVDKDHTWLWHADHDDCSSKWPDSISASTCISGNALVVNGDRTTHGGTVMLNCRGWWVLQDVPW